MSARHEGHEAQADVGGIPDGRQETEYADGTAFAGRAGRYLLLRDREGLRHAVRSQAILAVSDLDGGEDMSVVMLQGGRVLIVPTPLPTLLAWLD